MAINLLIDPRDKCLDDIERCHEATRIPNARAIFLQNKHGGHDNEKLIYDHPEIIEEIVGNMEEFHRDIKVANVFLGIAATDLAQ